MQEIARRRTDNFEVTRISTDNRSNAQAFSASGTDWLRGLNENIDALNRNINQNVHQLNRRIHETVQQNLAQVHRMTQNLHEDSSSSSSSIGGGGGSSSVIQSNDGTRIVQSGRTSDGKPYVRESTDRIVGDTLRHVERIYDPTTNSTKVHGYTLDLKDPNARPVPINETFF
ncbi:hypothetical protein WN51_11320 [Melipona quadrifasciata]|uniref:Uncharacterized protein n=1 Tax=Melipona quadrifasciata TaxID=166423 RepID=A0A0M9A930_9HYME|nr:hypothetical protein WN51_11320 [Melipona quadrifasciata]